MNKNSGIVLGIKGGIVLGLVYAGLLWLKFSILGSSPFGFWAGGFVSYALVIAGMVILGMNRKRRLGGYAEIKEIFQTLFIAVIFIELAYIFFTYYYLNYLNPTFFEAYKNELLAFGKSRNVDAKKVEEQISLISEQQKSSHDLSILFKGLFIRWIIIDSIFAMIISFLLRKKRPEQETDTEMPIKHL